jgi:SpoVK/Ycf46/Vps4 family AAA+-type ATPase
VVISFRELGMNIKYVSLEEVRPIVFKDFSTALQHIRPSVSKESLKDYEKYNAEFGTKTKKL